MTEIGFFSPTYKRPALASGFTCRFDRTEDAPRMAALFMLPGIYESLGQMPVVKPEVITQLLAGRSRRETGFVIESETTGEMVACAFITDISPSPRRSHAISMMVAVHPDHRRSGLGRFLVDAILHYITNWTTIHRVEFMVSPKNPPAIKLYESFGFKTEGTHEDYVLTNGKFEEVISMVLIIRR